MNIINTVLQNFICPQCLRCGSYFVQVNFFCPHCQNFLEQKLNLSHESLENTIDVVTLIDWPPGESDSLSELIYLLKSPLSGPAWAWYSASFFHHLNETQLSSSQFKSTLLIPIPGSQKISYHTLYFARRLSSLINSEFRVALKKQGQRKTKFAQKTLGRQDRKLAKFELLEDFTLRLKNYENIILVDDVITTGATVKACYNTLKPHLKSGANVTVFSLFKRNQIQK